MKVSIILRFGLVSISLEPSATNIDVILQTFVSFIGKRYTFATCLSLVRGKLTVGIIVFTKYEMDE